jgi:hypothetical protein
MAAVGTHLVSAHPTARGVRVEEQSKLKSAQSTLIRCTPALPPCRCQGEPHTPHHDTTTPSTPRRILLLGHTQADEKVAWDTLQADRSSMTVTPRSRPAPAARPPGFCLQLSRRLIIFQLSQLRGSTRRSPGPSAHGGTSLYLHDISCATHAHTLARYCIALVIHPIAHNHLLLTVFCHCHLH